MAPSEEILHIYHTYKRCSLATKAVVLWLCVNAEICGHAIAPPKPTSKSGIKRAKMKAKKDPGSNEFHIPVAEYLTLAKVITASSEPLIQVPAWVLHLLSDLIDVREICTSIYSSQSGGDLPNSAESLSRPKISILKEVLRVLESGQVKRDQDSPIHFFSEAHTLRENLLSTNPYDRLFPDEPVKAGEYWQQCSLSTKPVFAPVSDYEEETLRFQCFIEDSLATRRFLRKCWEACRRKETDLYAVSVITNTAIQYLQGILSEITNSHPDKPMDYAQFLTLAADSMNSSAEIFHTFLGPQDKPIDRSVWVKAEKICLPAYRILADFIKSPAKCYTDSCLSLDQPLEIGTEPAKLYDRFKSILYHLFGELLFAFSSPSWKNKMRNRWDMLTMGIYETLTKRSVPFWLPLASMIYLDIYEALDSALEAGSHDLLLSCQRNSRTLKDFLRCTTILDLVPKHVPAPKDVTNPAEEQQTRCYQTRTLHPEDEDSPYRDIDEHVVKVVLLINDILWVEGDSISPVREGNLKRIGWKHPKTKPHHLLKIHPLLCGVIDFHFTLRMQDASLEAINDWGVVLSVSYLYSALRNEIPISEFTQWQDMEMLNWVHTEDIGGRPRNAAEFLSRFEENIRFRALDFNQSLPPGATTDLFRPKSRCFNLLYGQYCSMKPLDLAKFEAEWKWTGKTFLTPERLCLELALCLKVEFFALKFNYLTMHTRCARMLHRIHWDLDDKFNERFGQGYIEKQQHFPFLVGYLLTDLCMHRGVKKLREKEQRMCLAQHEGPDVWNNSDSGIVMDDAEEYETACDNNEVHECESERKEDDAFEDYDSRDPSCAAFVPAFLYQAGELMDVIVRREGDWEHKALESIKDPQKVNPALVEPELPTTGDINDDIRSGWLGVV